MTGDNMTGDEATSPKQILANRENALRSTGPRTAEGRAASARNALKHGLGAATAVLPGEDPGDYRVLLHALVAEHGPRGELEFRLVERVADALWRLARIRHIEASVLYAQYQQHRAQALCNLVNRTHRYGAYDFDRPKPDEKPVVTALRGSFSEATEALISEAALLGGAFVGAGDGPDIVSKLGRYEARIERGLYRALAELKQRAGARALDVTPRPEAEAPGVARAAPG